MYFWKTDLLIEDLRAGAVSEIEKCKYLIASWVLLEVAMLAVETDRTDLQAVDYLVYGVQFISIVAGLLFAFKKHGAGPNFVERVVCFTTPLSARMMVVIIPPLFSLALLLELALISQLIHDVAYFTTLTLISVWFYLRLGQSLAKVSA